MLGIDASLWFRLPDGGRDAVFGCPWAIGPMWTIEGNPADVQAFILWWDELAEGKARLGVLPTPYNDKLFVVYGDGTELRGDAHAVAGCVAMAHLLGRFRVLSRSMTKTWRNFAASWMNAHAVQRTQPAPHHVPEVSVVLATSILRELGDEFADPFLRVLSEARSVDPDE